jgi:hypothetical protein
MPHGEKPFYASKPSMKHSQTRSTRASSRLAKASQVGKNSSAVPAVTRSRHHQVTMIAVIAVARRVKVAVLVIVVVIVAVPLQVLVLIQRSQ